MNLTLCDDCGKYTADMAYHVRKLCKFAPDYDRRRRENKSGAEDTHSLRFYEAEH